MAENVKLRLFDDEAASPVQIILQGTRPGAGSDVTLSGVVVTLPNSATATYPIVDSGDDVVVPAAFINEANGPTDLRFQPAAPGLVVNLRLSFAAGDVPFFGAVFEEAGGVELNLALHLPATAPAVAE